MTTKCWNLTTIEDVREAVDRVLELAGYLDTLAREHLKRAEFVSRDNEATHQELAKVRAENTAIHLELAQRTADLAGVTRQRDLFSASTGKMQKRKEQQEASA